VKPASLIIRVCLKAPEVPEYNKLMSFENTGMACQRGSLKIS
jgi:hypothetical protein